MQVNWKMSFIKLGLGLLLGLFLVGFNSARANQIHESAWVKDNAQVLNQTTISQINTLNETDLKQVKGHPQLAVETINGLPRGSAGIEDYAHDQMKQLGLGKKGWNNGILLVIDAKNHVNRLEVGTGLEAALPDGAKSSLVTNPIRQAFKQQDYNEGVQQLTSNLYHYLVVHQNEITKFRQTNGKATTTPGIQQNSVAATLQRNKSGLGFLLLLALGCGLSILGLIKLVFPKLRNRDQHILAQQRFKQTGLNDRELLHRLNQFITAELQQHPDFKLNKLSEAEWWYLLNALYLRQPISLAQNAKLEIKMGNPLYQTHLVSPQAVIDYQIQLQQRKQANLKVVAEAAQRYAIQHQFPGDLKSFVDTVVQQVRQLTWLGLPHTDNEFRVQLQKALEIILADATLKDRLAKDPNLQAKMRASGFSHPNQVINHLSDEQKKRIVTNGLVNTALLLGALGLMHHHDGRDFFSGNDGGEASHFDNFGSGFGGSGDDDGGGFNF